MATDISRRGVLGGAAAVGALGWSGHADRADAQPTTMAATQATQSSKPMTSYYIGTPTSRIDGRAKVTGAAKYAAEFNSAGLAYGAVVGSTIPKGRIVRIDVGDALRVVGVVDVLTHE